MSFGGLFRGSGRKRKTKKENARRKRLFAQKYVDDDDSGSDDDEFFPLKRKAKKPKMKVIKRGFQPKKIKEKAPKNIVNSNNSNKSLNLPNKTTSSEISKIEIVPQIKNMTFKDIIDDSSDEEEPKNEGDFSEESESESDSDSDSDDSDDEEDMRIVFVPKNERKLVKSKEELEQEAELKREKLFNKMEERKKSTQLELLKILVREDTEREELEMEGEEELPNDGDDENEYENEYNLWIEREKIRIIRDKKERSKYDKEQSEIMERRNMSEEKRKDEDKMLEKLNKLRREHDKDNSKFQFMQRYYKNGVFFQGEDEDGKEEKLFKRDYQVATSKDKKNYKLLPKILQKKYFGERGQSKYTHLSKEDTTDWESPWFVDGKDKNNPRKRDREGSSINSPSSSKKRKMK